MSDETKCIAKPGIVRIFPNGFVTIDNFEFAEGTKLAQANVAGCKWAIERLCEAIARARGGEQ